jgi:omega-6 fatty acid desaturase (delta-12 desaturase)
LNQVLHAGFDRAEVARTGADRNDLKLKARRLAAHCAAYRGAETRRAMIQLATTLVPFIVAVVAMFWSLEVSYLVTLALAIPTAGLLVRIFIIQHDCGHGSFLPSRTLNDALGRAFSVLTLTPYGLWRREHAQHHATSGNLAKRGVGDIETWTVAEYRAASAWQRLRYRLIRNPFALFLIGVPFYFVVLHRLPWGHSLPARETWKSTVGLDIGLIVLYGLLCLAVGYLALAKVALPVLLVASAIGGWLFFIQHQFEGTHWDEAGNWDFQVAAIHGSSYYVLPRPLQWMTGSIGLHHIHHLNSMIPNYRLQECLDGSAELAQMNRLTLAESLKCVHLALWDGEQRKLVRFKDVVLRA